MSFRSKIEKYGLSEMTYSSFNCSFGFRHKFCAGDLVLSILATLEHRDRAEQGCSTAFLQALDTLARQSTEKLELGVSLAKQQLEMLTRQVQNILDTKQVVEVIS